jgi:hypothetical protein
VENWLVADRVLYQLLKAWLLELIPTRPFFVDLFTNNFAGALSQFTADYNVPTQVQWPGYGNVELPIPSWTDPQVTENIATTTQPTPAIFSLTYGLAPVTIWGYLVTDCYANFLWAEQFASALVVPSPGVVQFGVSFNLGTYPPADPPTRMPVDEDDEEE